MLRFLRLPDSGIDERHPLKWLYNLPIRQKQMFGLFTSELISVIGLVGVGTCLIVVGGRQQLIQQVKSELSITAIQYDIKVDQMGFGFRGQSDNAAIIEAVQAHAANRSLSPELQEQVGTILANETMARTIEYATLVGSDLTIIASANANRRGEYFNPNNIVRAALDSATQIQTSEEVSWEELVRESPPLLMTLSPQSGLIRYTATPVLAPETGNPIGVLVSGDVVNGKLPIVQETVAMLHGGYSAVYLWEDNRFSPVAIFEDDGRDRHASESFDSQSQNSEAGARRVSAPLGQTLIASELLASAVQSPPQVITRRDRVGDTTYTLAAKAIVNYLGEPVGVLVRGTPEDILNALLQTNLSTQLVITIIALAADLGLAIVLGFVLIEPTRRLQKTAKQFAAGNFDVRATVFSSDEVGQLTQTFNDMADSLVKTSSDLQAQVEMHKQLNIQLQQEVSERQRAEAALQISEAQLKEKNQLLENTLQELQGTLHELKETQSQMIQSEKMSSLGQLVAGIAHEINNPVNFIYSNLPFVESYAQDLLALVKSYQVDHVNNSANVQENVAAIDLEFIQDDLLKTVASMQIGTERIYQIVRSLRSFSRMDEAECKAVDLHEGIDSTLLILQHRLNAQPDRPEITVVKEYGELPLVECYSGKLNQVLMNLFANAIDALDERSQGYAGECQPLTTPTLTIQTNLLPDDWVEIAIADNGPGMSKIVQSHLFEPFFTTKPVGKGTGMGLSISYQIITETHGGYLKCDSMSGQGAEFTIHIPLRQAAAT